MSAYQADNSFQFGNPGGRNRAIRRETILAMMKAALQSADYHFARQCALTWLAAFPGDIEISLLQAQAIIADGKPGQAIPALEEISGKDPFEAEAYRAMAQATRMSDHARYSFAVSSLYVLDGLMPNRARLEDWAIPMRQAYSAYNDKHYEQAETLLQETLHAAPDHLLAATLHLLVDRATQPPLAVYHLAEIYHTRWPECLWINLVLAEEEMELGNQPEAVNLLHLCAANDSTGQVARRLWGPDHPYRSLWPEDLVILFDQTIPAGVAMRLGWNQLPTGEAPVIELPPEARQEPASPVMKQPEPEDTPEVERPEDLPPAPEISVEQPAPAPVEDEVQPVGADQPGETEPEPADAAVEPSEEELIELIQRFSADSSDSAYSPEFEENAGGETFNPEVAGEASPVQEVKPKHHKQSRRKAANQPLLDETSREVEGELDRLANKLKQPAASRTDGRHSVYVIFTSKEGLEGQYGPKTARVLDAEMGKLAEQVAKIPGWSAIVYYPDDANCTAQYGLTPVNPRDPWKLKNALSDLDGALLKTGEMIGALLIVGGDKVIPFHHLPNPTDDEDIDVPSDSPYATLDSNYFVPEWPVGRLPGEKGPDVVLLLEQLRLITRNHAQRKTRKVWLGLEWVEALRSLFERYRTAKTPSIGYTAAVWRRSSLAVFRPIGAPHTVLTSPPQHSGSVDGKRIAAAALGYYNLHGLQDSPAWYGQRDPLEKENGADYPVALTPEDLRRNGHAPDVIFSEACYGGHVFEKFESESLALKFLSMGADAVIGSTTTSYGSVNTPLIAADLLGNLFWQHLRSGRTTGEALMQAKIDLVREMNRRQGFLDGEDQKTLISFVLYGDPLASYDGFRIRSKSKPRSKNHPMVKVVSDRPEEGSAPPKLSGEALKQVKQIVADYLPGLDQAEMHLALQSAPFAGSAKNLSPRRKIALTSSGRVVVTVSKQVRTGHYVHKHYVRLTLDEGGNPIKMSISR